MIDVSNIPPNSHKYKKEQQALADKKVKKVVSGTVKAKKKSELSKFMGTFISEDAPSVGDYILSDVLIPVIKNTILDIITGSANMIFGGSRRRDSRSNPISNISYTKFYERGGDRFRDDRRSEPKTKSRFDYDEITFSSRGDAEAVLMQMEEIIGTYKVVTVADLYDMIDLTAPYTAEKYGWMDIRSADVYRAVGGGYKIGLPKALPLD